MQEFKLKILTPQKKVYDGKAVYCSLVTTEGKMGIEARHEPFMAALKDGSKFLYRKGDGEELSLTVSNAMLTFEDNSCLVVFS